MSQQEEKIIRFDELNILGKSVFIAGSLVRLTANFIDLALDRTASLIAETEKAFKQGKDPNVEDAKILDEINER